MAFPVIQPSFAAGELGPALYARVDLAKWHVGAALLRNFTVDARGGVSNRVGTSFIIPCLPGINRLIDFTFSVTQTYALVFSDLKLRFVTNGASLVEAPVAITGASQANPCKLTIANTWSNGDSIYVAGVGGMTRLNGRFFVVRNRTAADLTLEDINGNAINSTTYAAYTAGGTAARVYTIASPYAAADLALLKYVQSADVMTLTHPSYQPRQLIRAGATSWSFAAISASASMQPPTGVSATPAVGAAATTYRYVVTSVNAQGLESAPSTAGTTTAAATMSTTAAENINVQWTGPATGPAPTIYKVYRQIEVPGGAPAPAELFGYVGSAAGLAFVDHNVLPDFTTTPPIAYDPFAASAFPACSTYYQGRQVYAGATAFPETLNASKTGDFFNFSYSSPSRANDGIVATIASRKVNAIKHMIPMQSLVVLSASGAWRVDAGSAAGGISPANITAVPQAFNGCGDVPPIAINYDILYVQEKGSTVRDLAYNFYVNVYTGQDMTVLSNHLFLGHQILEWAWAEEPFKIVWAVRDDGYLLSFTYLKEQDIYGWAHHDTEGQFKSVCAISEGNEDAVYLVVQREIGGFLNQYVERMASRNMQAKPEYNPPVPAHLELAWFVDCGLSTVLTTPNATLTPAATGRAAVPLPAIVYTIVGVDNVNGGTGYSATPTITVADEFGTGAGAQLTATVVAGVITGYTVVDSGMNYQKPLITINDATGTGAVAQSILTNDVVMNASGAISVSVGDMVRVNDGWGPIRLVNSATRITVNVQQPLSSKFPAVAGTWSATTPVTAVHGLDHLEGEVVSVLADGNVFANGVDSIMTVVDGALTLPHAASAVTVGKGYRAQFQSLYADLSASSPTVQGRRISIPAVTMRVQDTRGMSVGHNWGDLTDIKERDFQLMGAPILPITGDERIIIGSNWQVGPQVCAQQVNPLPCTILGIIPEILVGDSD